MTQEFLNGPEIGATLQQVRRERMPQGMRAHPGADAAGEGVPSDEAIHAPYGQACASIVDEQRIDGASLT
jgi:hypothetical protein